MSTRVIYRVEKATDPTRGPYHVGLDLAKHNNRENTHPSPFRDLKIGRGVRTPMPTGVDAWDAYAIWNTQFIGIEQEEFCGLRTLDDVAKWFDGYGKSMEKKGLVVVELEVPKRYIRHGKKQVVFKRDKAKVLRVLAPTEIIK